MASLHSHLPPPPSLSPPLHPSPPQRLAKPQQMRPQKARPPATAPHFRLGDLVWAKVKSHPWWPGQIFDPASASSMARKSRRKGHVLVAFFGDSTFGWFPDSQLIPFHSSFRRMSQQTDAHSFCVAVEDALEEIERRVRLGLTCACRNAGDAQQRRSSAHPQASRHQAGVLNLDWQIAEARKDFESSKVVSFVKSLACSPLSSARYMLKTTKTMAQVHAFRAATSACRTSEYEECFGNGVEFVNGEKLVENALSPGDRQGGEEAIFGMRQVKEIIADEREKEEARFVKDSSADDSNLLKKSTADGIKRAEKRSKEWPEHCHVGRQLVVHKNMGGSPDRRPKDDNKKKRVIKIGKVSQTATLRGQDMLEGNGRKAYESAGSRAENVVLMNGINLATRDACGEERMRHQGHSESQDGTLSIQEGNSSKIGAAMSDHLDLQNGALSIKEDNISKIGALGSYVEYRETPNSTETAMIEDKPAQAVVKRSMGFKRLVKSLKLKEVDFNLLSKLEKSFDLEEPHRLRNPGAEHVLNGPIIQAEQVVNGPIIRVLKSGSKRLKVKRTGNCKPSVKGNSETANLNRGPLETTNHAKADEFKGEQANLECIDAFVIQKVAASGIHSRVLKTVCNARSRECSIKEPVPGNDHKGGNAEVYDTGIPICCNNTPPRIESDVQDANGTYHLKDTQLAKVEVEVEGLPERQRIGADLDMLKISNEAQVEIVQVDQSGRGGTEPASMESTLGKAVIHDIVLEAGSKVQAGNCGGETLPEEKLAGIWTKRCTSELQKVADKKSKEFRRLLKGSKSSQFPVTGNVNIGSIKRVLSERDGYHQEMEAGSKKLKVSNNQSTFGGKEKLADGSLECEIYSQNSKSSMVFQGSHVNFVLKKQEADRTKKHSSHYGGSLNLRKFLRDLVILAKDPLYGDEAASVKVLTAFAKFREAVSHNGISADLSSSEPDLASASLSMSDNNGGHFETATVTKQGIEMIFQPDVFTASDRRSEVLDGRSLEQDAWKRTSEETSDVPAKRPRKVLLHAMTERGSPNRISFQPSMDSKIPLDAASDSSNHGVPSSSQFSNKSASKVDRVSKEMVALFMKFPQSFALPSEAQLRATFVRFGPLNPLGTRIYCNSGCAQVVYRHASDAEAALKHVQENNVFGQAPVNFRLRIFPQIKEKEASRNALDPVKESKSMREDLKGQPFVLRAEKQEMEVIRGEKPSVHERNPTLHNALDPAKENIFTREEQKGQLFLLRAEKEEMEVRHFEIASLPQSTSEHRGEKAYVLEQNQPVSKHLDEKTCVSERKQFISEHLGDKISVPERNQPISEQLGIRTSLPEKNQSISEHFNHERSRSSMPLKSCLKKLTCRTAKKNARVTFQLSCDLQSEQSIPCKKKAGHTLRADQEAANSKLSFDLQNNGASLLGSASLSCFQSPCDIGDQMMTLLHQVSALVGSPGIVL